jgi:hypothetical protein
LLRASTARRQVPRIFTNAGSAAQAQRRVENDNFTEWTDKKRDVRCYSIREGTDHGTPEHTQMMCDRVWCASRGRPRREFGTSGRPLSSNTFVYDIDETVLVVICV